MTKVAEAMVVDASVAAKWHLKDEEFAEQALVLLDQFSEGDITLYAPDQIRYEVPSAITLGTTSREPRLSKELGLKAIEGFLSLGISLDNSDEIILNAYSLVHQYGIAIYDALYLALAQKLSIPFITADFKLYKFVQDLPDVIWIGDYQ